MKNTRVVWWIYVLAAVNLMIAVGSVNWFYVGAPSSASIWRALTFSTIFIVLGYLVTRGNTLALYGTTLLTTLAAILFTSIAVPNIITSLLAGGLITSLDLTPLTEAGYATYLLLSTLLLTVLYVGIATQLVPLVWRHWRARTERMKTANFSTDQSSSS
jgi:hypothetical protein